MSHIESFEQACQIVRDTLKNLVEAKSGLDIAIPRLKAERDRFSQLNEEKKKELTQVNIEIDKSRRLIASNTKVADNIIKEVKEKADIIIGDATDKQQGIEKKSVELLDKVDNKIKEFEDRKNEFEAEKKEYEEEKEKSYFDQKEIAKDRELLDEKQKRYEEKQLEQDKREMIIATKEQETEELLKQQKQLKEESGKITDKARSILDNLMVEKAKINKLSAQLDAREKTVDNKLVMAYRKEKEIQDREIRLNDREQTLKTNLTL